MKIPHDAIILKEKVTDYLLAWQTQNDKSKFLAQAGFRRDRPEELITQLRSLISSAEAIEDGINQYGTFYRVTGILVGPNGGGLTVITIWIQWHLDGNFRFVTLKPYREA